MYPDYDDDPRSKLPNYYWHFMDVIEAEGLPDMETHCNEITFDYDDLEYHGPEHYDDAKSKALELIENWQEWLDDLRKVIQAETLETATERRKKWNNDD